MSKPQLIIAATDFSARAQRAVQQAAHLAQVWQARLNLVHVFNDSIWAHLRSVYDPLHRPDADPAGNARNRLAALGEQVARESGLSVETDLLHGRASQQIGAYAASSGAGMLVVGEHGESLVSRMVLGGTALKVLEAARIPVLLVRRATPDYRSVLVATDFSASSARAARLSLDCFPQARHSLVHAWMVPFEASMRMGGARDEDIEHYREREFATASAELDTFVQQCGKDRGDMQQLALYGAPAAVVLDQAEAGACDLIAIGKHGGDYTEELLLGSVTQNILYHAECDVLLSP
ncbi:MAG TPA: universal stress protein [Gallionella sp.]